MPAKGEKGRSRVAPLRQDHYVDRLRPSPSDPAPRMFELHGFLGQDDSAGFWRIYVRTDLSAYLKVSEVDILDVQRSDAPGAELSPSRVFITASAELEWVTSGPPDTRTSFVQGQYTAALPQSARNALALAVSANRQRFSPQAEPETDLAYPATPGFPCQPQITIESNTCYCTIFSCTR